MADRAIDTQEREKLVVILENNWQAEMSGYYTYSTLAGREPDIHRRAMLLQLATAEKHHADLWESRIREIGANLPDYHGKPTGEADDLAGRTGGMAAALRQLEIDEGQDIAKYAKQLEEIGDGPSVAILHEVIADERDHYRILRDLASAQGLPSHRLAPAQARAILDDLLTRRQQSGARAGGWIGDAVYGVNDGLGAIFGVVSGVSGATLGNSKFVLLAGIAGMVASALSMGSGAYLAAKSEREIYEAELARDREAINLNESEGRELLSLYYQLKGLPEEDADRVVEHIADDRERFVKALTAERLNSSEEALSNPVVSALSGALSTAVGAFIPVVPFFFMSGYPAVVVAGIVSLVAHFAVGAAKALITVRKWWASGFEMTVVGAIEGVVTYVIGVGLGHLGA